MVTVHPSFCFTRLRNCVSAHENGIAGTKTLMGAGSPEEAVELQARMVAPLLEAVAACARGVHEIAAQKQEEMAKLVEDRLGELNRQLAATLDEAAKYAPAGSETVVENVKTAFAAAQSAYNNVVSINKQIYDTVEKTVEQNVATVKSATAKAKSKKR